MLKTIVNSIFLIMDKITTFNQKRWNQLSKEGVLYSLPWLDLDKEMAQHLIDPHNQLGKLKGKNVLCLASGGGQQSAAFTSEHKFDVGDGSTPDVMQSSNSQPLPM